MAEAEFAGLRGKIAVVTGSSSGIGRAIAQEFSAAGADVIVHAARSMSAAEELAEDFRRADRRAAVLQADFSLSDQRDTFVDRVWDVFGRVDVWVNNAGVDLLTTPDATLDYAAKLQKLWDVDVSASVILSKQAGKRMQEQGGGAILNIGWDQADRGMDGDSGELFAASKNAIMGFTRSLAVSLAPTVRVNCIAPGWIRTKWGDQASEYWQARVAAETPLQRWGEPRDIANLTRYLCSDAADFITGQVWNVNGGAVR